VPGIESTADTVGAVAAGAALIGVGAHFISTEIRRAAHKKDEAQQQEGR
jgi:dihydroorotate dehydrogenase